MTVDVLGIALTQGETELPLLVERSDGHTSTADLGWWLRRPGARPPADLPALDWVNQGPVLDIGCATGRHLELLTRRSIRGAGIDTCAAAVALAQEAGMTAKVADAHEYRPCAPVPTVLALGGGLGIAGTQRSVIDFLARLASWTTPDGQLIVSSVDWAAVPGDLPRTQSAYRPKQYPGDITLRLRYGPTVGDWFEWVWIDPQALRQACTQVGLTVQHLVRWGSWYAAVLRRQQ